MKVYLLHTDHDFDVKPELRDQMFAAMLSGNLYAVDNVIRDRERQRRSGTLAPSPDTDAQLVQDLELTTLWKAMAAGDLFLFEMARRVLLSSLRTPEDITYRQDVLADCLEHPTTIHELYALAIEALASERQVGSLWSSAGPTLILHRSVHALKLYVNCLRRLREIADQHDRSFRSEGFRRFFAMVRGDLSDEYLETVAGYLHELEFTHGIRESAQLGKGDKGQRYTVHTPPIDPGWKARLPFRRRPTGFTFELHPRDEPGFRALEEIQARAVNHVADATAQSADHVKSFFAMLRLELAFYIGCLNLRRHLDHKGEPTCFPEPVGAGNAALTADGIYDACLALRLPEHAVGNTVRADGKSLIMITGANQGGKSTLLRSLGLAQLMMQSGMFVGAHAFRAEVCAGVFTHYKREEDATMHSGKLDEELSRMSTIADRIGPRSLLLCNESFASTNEREGSEIARQVIRAMLEKQIKICFVTHLYDLAHGLDAEHLETALFLRAQREPDGRRTFKLLEGEPLPTSFGQDSYRRIFGKAGAPSPGIATSAR